MEVQLNSDYCRVQVTRCQTQKEKGRLAKDKEWGRKLVLEMVQP